jgi:thymidylate synthase (FAD)
MDLQGAVVAATAAVSSENKKYICDGIGFVELLECFGSDLTVANAARVSFSKEATFETVEVDGQSVQKLADRDAKLINFLAEHRHNSPFFHPQVRLRIKMPIFVAREWWRSTIGFARNEVSRRYITQDPEFFLPPGLRQRDKNLKQGSQEGFVENNTLLLAEMAQHYRTTLALYQKLMADGVAPEQARMVLPQSMYTEYIETASLAGYARVVLLRTDPTAQREIQEYARLAGALVETAFPVSWKALMNSPIM